jgi:hypothetical protein
MALPVSVKCLPLIAVSLLHVQNAVAAEPVCTDGSGCTMFASWSPLTDDTQWIMECEDGFFHTGILSGNVECLLCPC